MRSICKLRKNSKFTPLGRAWHIPRGKLVARANIQPQQRNILRNQTLILWRYSVKGDLQWQFSTVQLLFVFLFYKQLE